MSCFMGTAALHCLTPNRATGCYNIETAPKHHSIRLRRLGTDGEQSVIDPFANATTHEDSRTLADRVDSQWLALTRNVRTVDHNNVP